MTLSIVPLWILPQPTVDLQMLESRQKEGMSEFEEIWVREYLWTEYGHLTQVCSDASKNPDNEQIRRYSNCHYKITNFQKDKDFK